MNSLLSNVGIGIVVFATAHIDDLFVLAAFFADKKIRPVSIVLGQYVGIGALVLLCALASLVALAIPEGWVALVGIVPLSLGVWKLLALRNDKAAGHRDRKDGKKNGKRVTRSQVLAVAGVALANGGDDFGVYVPLFASNLGAITTYALTFAVMTGVWCGLGYLLVNNKILGDRIRRYGQVALPIVLIALGVYILSDALVLFH
jgi:cadmium resistance protein CadD (predicted permease)